MSATVTITISPCDVRGLSLSGEFDGFDDAQIQGVIDDILLMVNASVCADLGPMIAKNLAAHLVLMRARKGHGPAGPVTAQAAGKLSRSYGMSGKANDSSSYAYFAQTAYGQEYWRLTLLLPSTPMATNTDYGHLYRSC